MSVEGAVCVELDKEWQDSDVYILGGLNLQCTVIEKQKKIFYILVILARRHPLQFAMFDCIIFLVLYLQEVLAHFE